MDHLAKSASLIGDPLDNNITYKKILFSLRHEYSCIDAHFIDWVSKGTDSYCYVQTPKVLFVRIGRN